MQAVAEPVCEQVAAHYHLGLGVLRTDVRHAAVTLRGGETIGHGKTKVIKMFLRNFAVGGKIEDFSHW